MQDVLRRMTRAKRPPLHTLTPAQARLAYAAGADVLEVAKAPLARLENLSFPARDGIFVAARLYSPINSLIRQAKNSPTLPVLLYFHGGGFTIGSIDTHDVLCRQLSFLSGCAVVSVDYRLAPEHPFPAAVNDAWDALQWLVKQAGNLGLDVSRIAVGGDSAGGTLAAVCAILARDAGLPLALQLLFYPGCTPHQDTPSHAKFAAGFVLEAAQISWFFDGYARSRAERADWRFAPLNAPDLSGVAPAWLGLAECDPLVDEGLLYADKLRAAGVPVDLEIYRGVTHEFIKMGRVIPEAIKAHADAATALKNAFLSPTP
ncbi:MAG: alpha/beta hydrolase [Chitinophagaceae bacterium]|nr:alpha/beta hydrolase [Polaromonas sp.]